MCRFIYPFERTLFTAGPHLRLNRERTNPYTIFQVQAAGLQSLSPTLNFEGRCYHHEWKQNKDTACGNGRGDEWDTLIKFMGSFTYTISWNFSSASWPYQRNTLVASEEFPHSARFSSGVALNIERYLEVYPACGVSSGVALGLDSALLVSEGMGRRQNKCCKHFSHILTSLMTGLTMISGLRVLKYAVPNRTSEMWRANVSQTDTRTMLSKINTYEKIKVLVAIWLPIIFVTHSWRKRNNSCSAHMIRKWRC